MLIDDYVKQQNASLDFFKRVAKGLQELNKELKNDNDRYDEQQMNEMCKYYESGGLK